MTRFSLTFAAIAVVLILNLVQVNLNLFRLSTTLLAGIVIGVVYAVGDYLISFPKNMDTRIIDHPSLGSDL